MILTLLFLTTSTSSDFLSSDIFHTTPLFILWLLLFFCLKLQHRGWSFLSSHQLLRGFVQQFHHPILSCLRAPSPSSRLKYCSYSHLFLAARSLCASFQFTFSTSYLDILALQLCFCNMNFSSSVQKSHFCQPQLCFQGFQSLLSIFWSHPNLNHWESQWLMKVEGSDQLGSYHQQVFKALISFYPC